MTAALIIVSVGFIVAATLAWAYRGDYLAERDDNELLVRENADLQTAYDAARKSIGTWRAMHAARAAHPSNGTNVVPLRGLNEKTETYR